MHVVSFSTPSSSSMFLEIHEHVCEHVDSFATSALIRRISLVLAHGIPSCFIELGWKFAIILLGEIERTLTVALLGTAYRGNLLHTIRCQMILCRRLTEHIRVYPHIPSYTATRTCNILGLDHSLGQDMRAVCIMHLTCCKILEMLCMVAMSGANASKPNDWVCPTESSGPAKDTCHVAVREDHGFVIRGSYNCIGGSKSM